MAVGDLGSTMRCRAAANLALVATVVVVTLLADAPASQADFYNGAYTATASASLIGLDLTPQPGIVFDQLVDAGASEAQAQIDSLGTTAATAADPYPSTSVLGLPGLIASEGAPASLPGYPLVASSDSHTPSDHKSAGSIQLDAQSTASSSKGTVTDGATSGTATTTFDPASQRVSSLADSQISSLSAGDTLTISGVHTTASMVVKADGTATQDSSFTIGSLTVLGQRVSVDGSGLHLAGNDLPLGIDPTTVLAPLLSQLAAQGISITYLPVTKTATSITSAGIKIDGLLPVPQGVIPSLPNLPIPLPIGVGVSGENSVITEITIGRATASVTNSSFGNDDLSGGSFTVPTGSSPSSTAPATSSTPGSTVGSGPAVTDPGTLTTTDAGTGSLLDTSVGSAGAPQPDVAAQAPSAGLTTASAILDRTRLDRFYPVLFLAAMVGLGFVHLIRNLGVRNP